MKKLQFFILLALLCACNSNEPDAKKVLQEITSPIDCTSSKGWSWNNGVATASAIYEDDSMDKYTMTFNAVATGELIFAYSRYQTHSWIAVYFDNNEVFKEHLYNYNEWTDFSLSVGEGQIIAITGEGCKIRNIRIVGQADNTRPDTPDNPNWDF